MVAYSFLMNRTNNLMGQIELAAVRTLDIIKQRYYSEYSEVDEKHPKRSAA
jgi:hypothetical protein